MTSEAPTAVELATHTWAARGATATTAATAPLAVLVHGVTGWHRTWWRVGPSLAERGWRVVAVDQRGHGRSPRIDGSTTVGEWAADLASLIDRAGTPADVVIGHSLGAAVTAELALVRPELVRRMVLEDPPAVTRTDDLPWQANLERELLAAVADRGGEVARTRAANPAWLDEDVEQDVDGKRLADRAGLLASFRRGTGARVLDAAARQAPPALYVLADPERSVFPPPARERLRSVLPARSRIVELAGGHTLHRDAFDDYLRTIVGWLGGPGRG